MNRQLKWLACVLAMIATLGASASIRASAQEKLEVLEITYPTFGLMVKMPTGYSHAPVKDVGHIARWVSDVKPVRMFLMETVPAGERTLSLYVEEMKKQKVWTGGKEESATLGGEPAVRLVTTSADPIAPREAFIAKHDRYIYTLSRFLSDDAAAKRDFELVWLNWKWAPYESPHSNMVFLDDEMRFFGGRLKIPVPDIMRPFIGEDHPKLGVFDYKRGLFSMIVDIQTAPNPKKLTLDQVKANFAGLLTERMGLKEKVVWKANRRATRSLMTQTLEGNLADAGPQKTHFRMGLSMLDPNTLLIFTLTMTGQAPPERKRFEEGFAFMMEGIAVKSAADKKAKK